MLGIAVARARDLEQEVAAYVGNSSGQSQELRAGTGSHSLLLL